MGYITRYRIGWIFLLAMLTPELRGDERPADFGKQWLRQHPFTIMGSAMGFSPSPFNLDLYMDAGFTSVFANKYFLYVGEAAVNAGVPWQMHYAGGSTYPYGDSNMAQINDWVGRGGATAWMLPDEPATIAQLQVIALQAQWMREHHPELLIYINLAGTPVDSFVQSTLDIVKPDALMFDRYPFKADGTTDKNAWFSQLMVLRNNSLQAGIPYWGFLQSFSTTGANVRTPSESDNRFNAFSLLTAGFTGLNYWTYDDDADNPYSPGKFLDPSGNPTAFYHYAAAMHHEIARVGESIRFLTSTDVRFVPGRRILFGSTTIANSTPTGLTNWVSGSGGDTHLLSVAVDVAQPGHLGLGKDGLIGFFSDDDGQQYFMLTNLYQGASLSADAASLQFILSFDSTVNSIWRLNRITGLAEEITLSNHILNWTLRGGTGDLFKYDNGNFAGLTSVIPGDFDSDGDVDGADFVAWQTNFPKASGATLAGGDADGDGDVDGADFVVWQTHFPTSPASGNAPVPEPQSLIPAILSALFVWKSRRQFGRK